jgi:hypothetical protein
VVEVPVVGCCVLHGFSLDPATWKGGRHDSHILINYEALDLRLALKEKPAIPYRETKPNQTKPNKTKQTKQNKSNLGSITLENRPGRDWLHLKT